MKKTKNILILNYEFPPLGGGAGNALYNLLKIYSDFSNYNFTVIVSSFDKGRVEDFAPNIKIYYLNIGKNKKNLHKQSLKDLLAYLVRAYFLSKKLNKKENFDLIHSFFAFPVALIPYFLNVGYIVSLRGSDVPGHSPRFSFLYPFLRPLFKKILNKADFVVANSNFLKNSAQKQSKIKKNIQVIYNGVCQKKFQSKNDLDNIFRVLFVGRFNEVKGISYLLEAFFDFSCDKKDVELLLIGGGPLFKKLKEKYQSNKIKFLGIIKHKNLATYYARSKVFVLPSLAEGMSNTALEAMASGLSLLLSPVGDAKKLLAKNNGFIVKVKSSEDIKKKLDLLYYDKDLLDKQRKNSAILAKEFSWEKFALKYKEIYDKF